MNRLKDLIDEIKPVFDALIFSEGFVFRTPEGRLSLLPISNGERQFLKRWWKEMKTLGEEQ